jgi:hypothetical protein
VIPSLHKGRVAALNSLFDAARAGWVAIVDGDDIQHRSFRPADGGNRTATRWRTPCRVGCGSQNGRHRWPADRAPCVPAAARRRGNPGQSGNRGAAFAQRLRGIARGGPRRGGYRPAYRHAEDYDLWLRLSEAGSMANLPDRLVDYRIYPDQVSSRHVVEQMRNTAIAWLAHRARRRLA